MTRLRYIPGEDESMIETKLLTEGTDEEEEVCTGELVLPDEEEDSDWRDEILLDVDEEWRDQIASAVANIIIKKIDNVNSLSDERLRFFFEELSDGVATGIDLCNLTEEEFQLWYYNEAG